MGKNKRKRTAGAPDDQCAWPDTEVASDFDIAPADVAATARTLSALLRQPSLLRARECKGIRTQLYTLLRALSLSANTKLHTPQQLSHLVNESLEAARWTDALVALDAMHALGRPPKLGSVQRWIARIGGIWGSDMGCALASAIIRSSSPPRALSSSQQHEQGSIIDGITLLRPWDDWDAKPGAVDLTLEPEDQAIVGRVQPQVAANEAGAADGTHLCVWRDSAGTSLLDEDSVRQVKRFDVPFAEGAFGLQGVLSPRECARLVTAAHALGFVDASGYSFSDEDKDSRGEENSFAGGAAGVVWLADDATCAHLLARIRAHLPRTLPATRGGGALAGINARFRFYKYTPGAVYKPHIDGAWPGSGSDADGGYCLDAFGDRHSRLTLIFYLNDDFTGGETRFFFNAHSNPDGGGVEPGAARSGASAHRPDKGGAGMGAARGGVGAHAGAKSGSEAGAGAEDDSLHAQGVVPRAGGCLLFPHGDASPGVVHEGSAVLSGTKYIVRTDVLYMNTPKA